MGLDIWGIFTATIKQLLSVWPFWFWIPFAAMLLLWYKSPKAKGRRGEKSVFKALKKLPPDKYYILNDVLLKTDEGTSQIDHIVVSVYGLFVIETKNYQGRIYGSEKAYKWTQNIYGNKKTFKNPIHQNYGHIKAVEKLLSGYGNLPIRSVIAFSDSADLHIETDKTPVIYFKSIGDCILALSETESVSDALVKEIYDTLIEKNITDKEIRKEHVAEAGFKKYTNEEKAKQGICPRCGGNLVVRNGKNGQFKGCSNYPKCRYTENIE